jgi:enoyl-CoA hydratase/carnithine racemase
MLVEMEAQNKPVVAALNGPAFGGGLEVAMACHARVASAKAAFGLPELKLGLFPALGGTQRLPRLIGLQPAVNAILTSQTVPAPAALNIGLVCPPSPHSLPLSLSLALSFFVVCCFVNDSHRCVLCGSAHDRWMRW